MKTLLWLSFSLSFTAFGGEMILPSVSKSVTKFIQANKSVLNDQPASCETFEACSYMNYHVKEYRFHGQADDGFKKLVSLKPNEIWHGTSRFEMEYDPSVEEFLGVKDRLPQIEKGQVFFLELDILKKLHIPVAFKVVDLNHETKSLSFSYLKQNKSHGIQRITFRQVGPDFVVTHETRFQSDSAFRDHILYRLFHTKLIGDVWEDFKEKL